MELLSGFLLVTMLGLSNAASCPVTCTKSVSYIVSCGLFGWSSCTQYKSVLGTCYEYCVDGGWTSWSLSTIGACSKTCGGGTRNVTSIRTCTNPAPYNGGLQCVGDSKKVEVQTCNTQSCPINGGWSQFFVDNVTACSATCGGGEQTVTSKRTCTNPAPQFGGLTCVGSSTSTSKQICNTNPCPINGGWSSFQLDTVGACSVTCGGGQQTMNYVRVCNNPPPQYGGQTCQGSSTDVKTQACNPDPCPIDGGWSEFQVESTGLCSVPCGGGQLIITYRRLCNNPTPLYGGKDCEGSSTDDQTQTCNTQPCPIDGGWTDFQEESVGECPVTCGGGQQTVTLKRTCTNPAPQYGGKDCEGSDTDSKTRTCNTDPCPVHGGWSDWGVWQDEDECSALCGGGLKVQFRDRTCSNPAPAYGGQLCEGPSRENATVVCNKKLCGEICRQGQVTYIPKVTNNRRYYECVDGVANLMKCPKGTIWKQESTSCVNEV